MFLVLLVLVTGISCDHIGGIGLNFNYNTEYAPTYNNYRPKDYHFNYAVSDPHTGDHKSQWEVKENGVVRGGYSLLEPDGTTRIVEYVADEHGFRAVVKKIGVAIHPDHIETHGGPLVQPVLPEVAHYKAYDGQINNYANWGVDYLQSVEIPSAVDVHPQQHLLQPIPYQLQQPLLYQDEQVYGALSLPAEIHSGLLLQNQQQPVAPRPVATGYNGELEQRQYLELKQTIPEVPIETGLVPIGPSYQTVVDYGLSGNLQDDPRYHTAQPVQGLEYHGEYSQKVQNVIPSPRLEVKKSPKSEQFVIYYPGDKE